LDRRKVLAAIIFVHKTGIPWEDLPQEMGCGSGMTCWNYLKGWQDAGVWEKLHRILLTELREADKITGRVPQRTAVRSALSAEGKKQGQTLRIAFRSLISAPAVYHARFGNQARTPNVPTYATK
jgi:transposase